MSITHISKTAAAARLGISPDYLWEQALKVFNLRRMELYGKYLAPLNEEDKRQRDAEVFPLYEALRCLFPVEVEQEPALKDLPVAPPVTPAPQEPLPTILQKDKRKWKRRLLSVSFHRQKAYLIFLVVSTLLFSAFAVFVEVISPSQTGSSKTSEPKPDTVFVSKPASIVYVITKNLNVRDRPGLYGKIIDSLERDEQLYFLGKKTARSERIELNGNDFEDYWVKVRTESGIEGWVFGAFIHYYQKRL